MLQQFLSQLHFLLTLPAPLQGKGEALCAGPAAEPRAAFLVVWLKETAVQLYRLV